MIAYHFRFMVISLHCHLWMKFKLAWVMRIYSGIGMVNSSVRLRTTAHYRLSGRLCKLKFIFYFTIQVLTISDDQTTTWPKRFVYLFANGKRYAKFHRFEFIQIHEYYSDFFHSIFKWTVAAVATAPSNHLIIHELPPSRGIKRSSINWWLVSFRLRKRKKKKIEYN